MTTTRFTALLFGALLATTTVVGAASDLQARLDQISAEAGRARAEARELKQLLKAKQPDMAQVQQKVDTLRTHVDQLKQASGGIDGATLSLTTAQRAELEKVQKTAEVLQIFVKNQTDMLAGGDVNRTVLRAKAEGVAQRAGMVEQSVARMRGN